MLTTGALFRHGHAILLVALVASAIVEAFPHRLVLGPVASDVVVTAGVLLVSLIVFERPSSRVVAVVAALVGIALEWVHYTVPAEAQAVWVALAYHGVMLAFNSFATVVILANIFRHGAVDLDDVLGAVCGYLLAASAWSNAYSITELLAPGTLSVPVGFDAAASGAWHARIALSNYVSLGSLTSVGSGAIVPVRAPATLLTTLEAVFGQFYLAVVVAQLVGARLAQRADRHEP
jgi:hypothetical protein